MPETADSISPSADPQTESPSCAPESTNPSTNPIDDSPEERPSGFSSAPDAQELALHGYNEAGLLRSGSSPLVKIYQSSTDTYYACKVVDKKATAMRQSALRRLRTEIEVVKRVLNNPPRVFAVQEFFETPSNSYFIFDICTPKDVLSRLQNRSRYVESDAIQMVRNVLKGIEYLHSRGIVHRGVKPENLVFKSETSDTDVVIYNFRLCGIIDNDSPDSLKDITGTHGYMAPEVLKSGHGHGKPSDIWTIGITTFMLLSCRRPFRKDTRKEEEQAIIAGNLVFLPNRVWGHVSDSAKDFIKSCLNVDPEKRPTASQALRHRWLSESPVYESPSNVGDS